MYNPNSDYPTPIGAEDIQNLPEHYDVIDDVTNDITNDIEMTSQTLEFAKNIGSFGLKEVGRHKLIASLPNFLSQTL